MITQEMLQQLKAQYASVEEEQEQTVSELIEDIKLRYHETEIAMLDKIQAMMEECPKDLEGDELVQDLMGAFRHLAYDLRHHFEKEEYDVFPMMEVNPTSDRLLQQIQVLEQEHSRTEELIGRMEQLSQHYTYNGDQDFMRRLYVEMQTLFHDITQHESQENGVLFPKFE